MLNMKYKVMELLIDKNNIDLFIEPEWHRMFRQGHINKMKQSIFSGDIFGEVITINEINNEWRLINGNHRVRALRECILIDPSISMTNTLHIYHDLSVDDEKIIYGKLSRGIRETRSDKLKAYCNDILIWKLLQKDFPTHVHIYSVNRQDNNAITLSGLLEPYMIRKSVSFNFFTLDSFISNVILLTEDDYEKLKNIISLFIDIFGYPAKHNPFSQTTFMSVFLKIWYREIERTDGSGIDNVRRALNELKNRHRLELESICKSGGRSAQEYCYSFVIGKINKMSVKRFRDINEIKMFEVEKK